MLLIVVKVSIVIILRCQRASVYSAACHPWHACHRLPTPAIDKVSYKRQRFVAVFDREGVRMLYGFYYFTSCPVDLLWLRPKQKCYGMIVLRLAQRSWDAAETFRSAPGGNVLID